MAQRDSQGTAALLDAYLRRRGSPLAGYGATFVNAGAKHGVDPRLLVAISGGETSFGTTGNAEAIHNAWGWGPGISFPSWEAGIDAVAGGLRSGYLNEGRTTIPEIAAKWAPIGAGNDPNNLNSNWVRTNSQFYRELGGVSPAAPQTAQPQSAAGRPWAGLAEAFYDPLGSWDNGAFGGPIGHHSDHVHVSETNPQQMLRAIQLAQTMGLSPRENPYVDPVDPVHVPGSYHYRTFPGSYGGKQLGEGLDVSGDASAMARYYNTITGRAGGPSSFPTPPAFGAAAPASTAGVGSSTVGVSGTTPQRRPLPAAVQQALRILRS